MGGSSSKESNPTANNTQDRYNQPQQVEGEDYSKPLPRQPLPQHLQKIVDNEDSLWDEISSGQAPESTDTNVRYAAYATRVRTILLSAQRYVAYTSDIGESFRPVAHPYLVRSAYGVSWLYLTGDVAHEGYKAYKRQYGLSSLPASATSALTSASSISTTSNSTTTTLETKDTQPHPVPLIEDYRAVMAQRAVFQSLASMGLPAFTIHSVVRYSGQAMKGVKNARIRTWGPIGLGLACVPFLPYMFDEPVERAVEWSFHRGFEAFGGKEAVGHAPTTGREDKLNKEVKKIKEKEL